MNSRWFPKIDVSSAFLPVFFHFPPFGPIQAAAKTPLQPPGQTQLLAVTEQGEAWVNLAWKAPNSGGRSAAYRVLRRERPAGPWLDVATAATCAANLTNQERGKEFEFRIVALNQAGEGEPSNTALVVL